MTDAATPDTLPSENRNAVGFVLRLARAMHSYGYPAHRVEGALGEVARRLNLTAQFFSTPTSFMVSFGLLERQSTHLIRVEPGDVDLGKSADIEDIIREVVGGRMTLAQGSADLERVHAEPPRYGPLTTMLAFGLSSSAVSRFLGGGLREALVAGVIGLVIGMFLMLAGRLPGLGPLPAHLLLLRALLARQDRYGIAGPRDIIVPLYGFVRYSGSPVRCLGPMGNHTG